MIALLAVLRPVFRGLRLRFTGTQSFVECQLAVLRPVFRGLRRATDDGGHFSLSSACSAETRFQGIATCGSGQASDEVCLPHLAVLRPVFRGLRLSDRGWIHLTGHITCSAETRFQGIATFSITALTQPGRLASPLAVLRPVFRGLRRATRAAMFPEPRAPLAVLRPVFRGLRQLVARPHSASSPLGDDALQC